MWSVALTMHVLFKQLGDRSGRTDGAMPLALKVEKLHGMPCPWP